ncbi:MAG: OFA family MFS transporter [Lachnospiraceae bacterium]|nr:OFA family MFS transporter [Lachnospiraceae bacterium]
MKKMNRWVYAIIGVIVMLLAGLVYAWSVMAKSIGATYPDWSQGQLSMTFTLVMAFFCIGALIGGIMSKKISPKIFIICAGVLFLIGFLIAGATGATPVLLYLGFGVIAGLGAGFAYTTVMGTMSAWFPDKQGLISGILLMGFGLSAFIIGKVFAAVAPPGDDAWRGTFRILGIVICVVFVICSFFFTKPGPDFAPPAPKKQKTVREPATEINLGQMVRRPTFWMYYIWAILVSAAGLVLVSQASGIATQVGTSISPGTVATVVGLISILNGVGRVIFGGLFDKVGFRLTITLDMIVFVIAGAILIMALKSGAFPLIILGFVVGGFAYGGVTPTNSAIIADFFGRKNYAMNFSLINTNLLIASFASTIAGKLYDNSGSYMSCLVMMIGAVVLGAIVSVAIRRPKA